MFGEKKHHRHLRGLRQPYQPNSTMFELFSVTSGPVLERPSVPYLECWVPAGAGPVTDEARRTCTCDLYVSSVVSSTPVGGTARQAAGSPTGRPVSLCLNPATYCTASNNPPSASASTQPHHFTAANNPPTGRPVSLCLNPATALHRGQQPAAKRSTYTR